MSSGRGSRVIGMVLTLSLTGMALAFLVGMTEQARFIHDPTPLIGALAGAAIFFGLLRGPVGRAIAKMLDSSGGPDDDTALRIEQLEAQLSDLGFDQHRMAELEERLDFAERLLSQRTPAELPQHRTPV